MAKDSINRKVAWVIDQLVLRRKQIGMSHEKLAEKAKISRGTVSFVENRKYVPTIATLFKICKALGVSLGDIVLEYERHRENDEES